MEPISRRDVLLAGLALPGIVKAAYGGRPGGKAETIRGISGIRSIRNGVEPSAGDPAAGSLEFHGPHNPLGSDTVIISGIAEHVAIRTNGLLFPTITFTQCPAPKAHFLGTVSVRPEVMTMYFADILRNILHLGFHRVFVLNGHDGNIGPGGQWPKLPMR